MTFSIRRFSQILIWAAALLVASAPSRAETSGDPVAGYGLARQLCAQCHSIEAGSEAPRPELPSFADIAQIPSLSGLGLIVFLRTPHGNMPRYTLTETELYDLVAYIRSLGPR